MTMTDRKKVIEEMSLLRDFLTREERKAFKANNERAVMALMHYRNIVIKAISLLKEQEPKKKNRLPYSPDSNVQWT